MYVSLESPSICYGLMESWMDGFISSDTLYSHCVYCNTYHPMFLSKYATAVKL